MSGVPTRPLGRSGLLAVIAAVLMVGSAFLVLPAASNDLSGGTGAFHPVVTVVPAHGAPPVAAVTASHSRIAPIDPPRIPHAVTGPRPPIGQNINPTAGYSAEPAPMGIADLGISSTGTAYTYGTTEFLGTMYWNDENFGSSGSAFTLQLNVVLRFTDGGTTYAYWIQDVAEPTNDGSNALTMAFIDNIWNMSGSFAMNSNTLSGNGTIASAGAGEDYYYVQASASLPGSSEKISAPGHFSLLVRSYTATSGVPEVAFEYLDGATNYYVTYDNVKFPFATAVTQDNGFTVDGTQYTPAGSPLMYSAEMDLGGPGGGSSIALNSVSNLHIDLFRFNGDNFESTPGAWNFGGDTGETSSNVQSIWVWNKDGTLFTAQLNGTTRDDAPGIAYNPTQVGTVYMTAACSVTGGVLKSGSTAWYFNGTWADLTLAPGTYPMWVNDTTGGTDSLGSVTVTAGGNTSVSASSICSGAGPSVAVPTGAPASIDVGQTVTFSTVASGGTGPYTYTWSQSSTALGCNLANAASITCVPTAAGSGYTVTVYVTDSTSKTSSPQTSAGYTVDPLPAVTAPTPSATYGTVGTSVTFTTTASSGSGTYTGYSWTQSSSSLGCTLASAATITCDPTAGGNYTVSVTVTDSNGGVSAAAPSALWTVIGASDPTPSISPIEEGGTVIFQTTPSGGSGDYTTFTWTASNASLGCAASSTRSFSCTPTAPGTAYLVSVSVTDSAGDTSSLATSAPYTVTSGPTVSHPSPSVAETEIGQPVTFSATASGGSGTGYVYTWTASSTEFGCTLGTSASIKCTPTAAGSGFYVSVTVKDSSNGQSAVEKSAGYTVVANPTATASASPSSVPSDGSTWINVSVAGGIAPFTYDFTGLPGGCTSSSTNALFCQPTATGSFTVSVTVTDNDGVQATTTASLQVTSSSNTGGSAGGNLNTLELLLLIAVIVIVAAIGIGYARRRKQEPEPPPPWQGPPSYGSPPPWQETQPGWAPPPQGPPPGPYQQYPPWGNPPPQR